MSRGFHTTLGSASTDRIDTIARLSFTTQSWAVWFNLRAVATNPRVFEKPAGALEQVLIDSTNEHILFARGWTGGSNPQWSIAPASSLGVWHHLGITYDGGATTNDPLIYYDGSSQTVTQETADPTIAVDNSSGTPVIGNRPDNTRCWDGLLAEFATWSVILTAAEMIALANGVSPSLIRPAALVEYVPMIRDNVSLKLGAPTITGTAVQPHPRAVYPRRRWAIDVPAAGAAQDTPELRGRPYGLHGQVQMHQLLSQ